MAPPTGVMNEVGTTLVSPYLKPTSAWVEFKHFFTTPRRNQRKQTVKKRMLLPPPNPLTPARLASSLGYASYNPLPV